MTDILYRKAKETDADPLAAMKIAMVLESNQMQQDSEMRLFERTKEHFLSGLNDNSFTMYVALQDNAIIAMGGISYFNLPPTGECLSGKTAYVGNMYTSPEYRNQGIASAILSMLIVEAEQRGVERVLLKPTAKGKPIYEKFGFDAWSDAMVFFL